MRNLPKSITPNRLQAIPQRFVPTPKIRKPAPKELTGAQRVLIQEGKHCWMVRVADLMLLESDGNYTRVHFGMSHPMIARSIKCIEPSANGGFRVRLDSGYEIEISRRQGQLLKKQMTL